MIQETAPEKVTPDVLRRFEREAETIARSSAAGFGEMAAEHFAALSFSPNHPYESARPDHPLFLALADIAATYGMPIELHMEAITRDMPFPNAELAGPPNPVNVKENISAFERLLNHNPQARIVWIHAGWDFTGDRTVPLMRRLMERHPNLYMSVTHDKHGTPPTSPFLPGGALKPAWIAMLRAFPDRFMVGSDQFSVPDSSPWCATSSTSCRRTSRAASPARTRDTSTASPSRRVEPALMSREQSRAQVYRFAPHRLRFDRAAA